MIRKIKTEKFEGLAVLVPDVKMFFKIHNEYLVMGVSSEDVGGKIKKIQRGDNRGFIRSELIYGCEILGKVEELTEDQCADIVELGEAGSFYGYNFTVYKNYKNSEDKGDWFFKSTISFASLMQSMECYSVNPYGERPKADIFIDNTIRWKIWDYAQKKVGTWLILKKV